MTQTYIVRLNDGVKFKVENLDISTIHGLMNQNNIFAVKVGSKSILKSAISYIVPAESFVSEGHNIVLNIGGDVFYTTAETVDVGIEEITNNVNKQAYVKMNELMFNRGLFIYAEENVQEEQTTVA